MHKTCMWKMLLTKHFHLGISLLQRKNSIIVCSRHSGKPRISLLEKTEPDYRRLPAELFQRQKQDDQGRSLGWPWKHRMSLSLKQTFRLSMPWFVTPSYGLSLKQSKLRIRLALQHTVSGGRPSVHQLWLLLIWSPLSHKSQTIPSDLLGVEVRIGEKSKRY